MQSIKNSIKLFNKSLIIFRRYPVFLMPLLITWLIYAPIIICLKYWTAWDSLSNEQTLLLIIGVIFVFAFGLTFSCCVLLELVQQLENKGTISLKNAFHDTLKYDTISMIPIVIIWTVIWFILLLIQALLSKKKKSDREELTAENAARTLAGYNSISLSGAFVRALQKGIRMIVFLILPAIAWEDLSFTNAIKKGLLIFRSNLSVFVSGFLLTGFAAWIIFLPAAIVFEISDHDVIFPDWIWVVTIMYTAFAWSYSIYLEQMFAAELYLWYLRWEKEAQKAIKNNQQPPTMNDIPQPSLVKDTNAITNIV